MGPESGFRNNLGDQDLVAFGEVFNGVASYADRFKLSDRFGVPEGLIIEHDGIVYPWDHNLDHAPSFLLQSSEAIDGRTLGIHSLDSYPHNNTFQRGKRFFLPSIPLDSSSNVAKALLYLGRDTFEAEEIVLNVFQGDLDLTTKGSLGEFNYSRAREFDLDRLGGRGLNKGDGFIHLHRSLGVGLSPELATDLESQIFDGTLALVIDLLRRWEVKNGLNITNWSSSVSGVLQRTAGRVAKLTKTEGSTLNIPDGCRELPTRTGVF